jgi:hypothetical protein
VFGDADRTVRISFLLKFSEPSKKYNLFDLDIETSGTVYQTLAQRYQQDAMLADRDMRNSDTRYVCISPKLIFLLTRTFTGILCWSRP